MNTHTAEIIDVSDLLRIIAICIFMNTLRIYIKQYITINVPIVVAINCEATDILYKSFTLIAYIQQSMIFFE